MATELSDPLDEDTGRASSWEKHRRLLAIVLAVLVALLMVGLIASVIYRPDGCNVWQSRLGPVDEGDPDSFICVGP